MKSPAAALLLLLLAAGCGTASTEDGGAGSERERVEALAEATPEELVAAIRRASRDALMQVAVTRSASGDQAEGSYTLLASNDAWRVETAPSGDGGEDRGAALLAHGDEVCFDAGFRPTVRAAMAQSHGLVEFDEEEWSCAEAAFGVNALLTFGFRREDPRWRLANLTTEAGVLEAEVEDVDGEPLLRVTTTGVTRDGPLDPARPGYELWVDAEHRPVRMETRTLTWDFAYPDDVGDALAAPAAAERGSYGYAVGPGPGAARACISFRHCPERSARLTWGDGRRW